MVRGVPLVPQTVSLSEGPVGAPRDVSCQEKRGSGGGVLLLWRVAPLKCSRSPCWSAEEVWALMERFRRPLTTSGKSVPGQVLN